MDYNSKLKQVLPVLAVNAIGFQLLTIRKRFLTRKFTQKVDGNDWFLQNVIRRLMFVNETSLGSDKEKSEQMQVYVDMNRNFIENISVFGLLAFGVAVTVDNPSQKAVTALSVFTVCRVIHNFLFVIPIQPFRAFSFTPQLLCYVVLAWEMYSSS